MGVFFFFFPILVFEVAYKVTSMEIRGSAARNWCSQLRIFMRNQSLRKKKNDYSNLVSAFKMNRASINRVALFVEVLYIQEKGDTDIQDSKIERSDNVSFDCMVRIENCFE